MHQPKTMARNFKTDTTKKQAKMYVIEMLQNKMQEYYEWYLCEKDENGEYQELEQLDESDRAKIEAMAEISKALDKLV